MLNKVKEFTKSLSRRALRSGLAAPSIIGAAVLGDPLHSPFSVVTCLFSCLFRRTQQDTRHFSPFLIMHPRASANHQRGPTHQ
jgi:hypothetical protein